MKCPVDNATLVMSDRQGIEIDYCPECRGVWLDRGELDKIISRSEHEAGQGDRDYQQNHTSQPRNGHYDDDDNHHGDHNNKKHRKESWLGELFD
jgi:Zn-finger nucleic acid-binding protein